MATFLETLEGLRCDPSSGGLVVWLSETRRQRLHSPESQSDEESCDGDFEQSASTAASDMCSISIDPPTGPNSCASSTLCDMCNSIFEGYKQIEADRSDMENPAVQNHHSLAELSASADQGCRLCQILWEGIGDYTRFDLGALAHRAYHNSPSTYEIRGGSKDYHLDFTYNISNKNYTIEVNLTPAKGKGPLCRAFSSRASSLTAL